MQKQCQNVLHLPWRMPPQSFDLGEGESPSVSAKVSYTAGESSSYFLLSGLSHMSRSPPHCLGSQPSFRKVAFICFIVAVISLFCSKRKKRGQAYFGRFLLQCVKRA